MTENLICRCTQNGRVAKRQLQQRKKQAKEQRCQQQNDTRHETKRFLSHFMPPFGQNWKGSRERERQGFFVDIGAKHLEEHARLVGCAHFLKERFLLSVALCLEKVFAKLLF